MLLKCRSQIQEPTSFTYDAQFGWGLLSLGEGGGCVQLGHTD